MSARESIVLSRFQLLRNVGQFDQVSSAARIDLGKLTLIYAENGRGKTTLSAILRSFATGEALPIVERHRLGAPHPPEVIVALPGATARFQNGAWTQANPDIVIFDDVFVDLNVYSGLDVTPGHRQNLHELILGAQGVALAREVLRLADLIRDQNSDLRSKTALVQDAGRHGVAVDAFCGLPETTNVDEEILSAAKRLASLEQADAIKQGKSFASLTLPSVDVDRLTEVLAKSVVAIDARALEAVQAHFSALGSGAEAWVSSGVTFAGHLGELGNDGCPFCLQGLSSSTIFASYRAHFAESYKGLVKEVEEVARHMETTLRGDALAGFERQIQVAEKTRTFWSIFCTIPEIAIDTTELASAWQDLRDKLADVLAAKRADPLRPVQLDEPARAAARRFSTMAEAVSAASTTLTRANEDIDRVKEASKTGNAHVARSEVQRLQATKDRHSPTTAAACTAYLEAKAAKERLEADKVTAQEALDAHRSAVFGPYQAAINKYLVRFNAGFTVEQVQAQNAAGTPSCSYQLRINAHPVPLAGTKGARFKNTLSAGDRSTLALAFFFASLERDPGKANKVVVLDDPVSSFDEHRTLATIQEIRALAQQVRQVIVLSHSKPFLARIWQHADQKQTVALEVVRDSVGSSIGTWNVSDDSVTEYDRRHERLREYLASNKGVLREVAEAIRPVLEGYLRITCAADFPPGTLLGPFRNTARARAAAGNPILSASKLTELESLTEYANRFHHDTNPAWDTEHINDGELRGFVSQTLTFVGP